MNHEINLGQQPDNIGAPKPTILNLQDYSPTSWGKKAIASYLIPSNPEKSIKCHEYLGTPIVRKIVMNTVGRITTPGGGGNYRLDHNLPGIEAETNFMLKGSVFNESIHTIAALLNLAFIGYESAQIEKNKQYGTDFTGSIVVTTLNAVILIANLELVALQRYNRARMVKWVNKRFEDGETYSDTYKNCFGIDARAVHNFQINQQTENRLRQNVGDNSQENNEVQINRPHNNAEEITVINSNPANTIQMV